MIALLRETIDFFGEVGVWEFLSGGKWTPLFEPPSFGVRPLVIGTFLITVIALLVATPLGLGAAIYLSEYARPRVRKTIKPILEVLAGVPTIVFGYFALTFFTPNVLQDLLHLKVDIFNALAAGIIMGFMIIPTVASVAEDAMSAVPQSLREGAYGLGASKLHVSLRVVFPAALSGIVAAIVLGVSRAIGETMIVLLAAGSVASNSARPARATPVARLVHRRDRRRRHTDREHRVQDDLRGRNAPVRDHADHEPDLDPLRAEVQAGLRMSVTSATGEAIQPPNTRRRAKDLAFRLADAGLPGAVDPAARRAALRRRSPTAPAT